MSYCNEWEAQCHAGCHMSRWPWTELVTLVMRYAPPGRGFRRVLELGCGVGANIPFFADLGVDYDSVEGSRTAVAHVHERFPQLSERVAVGDYTDEIPFSGPFDLVADRSSLICNGTESISRCFSLLGPRVRDGSRFIAVDWFAVDHGDYELGQDAGDRYTRNNFSTGCFVGTGDVHFFDRPHLLSFFEGYRVLNLQHRRVLEEGPEGETRQVATWNIVAERESGSQV